MIRQSDFILRKLNYSVCIIACAASLRLNASQVEPVRCSHIDKGNIENNVIPEDFSDEKILDNVTVTAKKKNNALTSAGFTQVFDEKSLSRFSSASISDAVKRFSGTVIKDYGGIGGLKTVNVRGMGSEHTGVIYDGISVSNCQSGQIDLSNFSLDNVSTLSLSVGQGDNIFHSAKVLASAASLFIETRKPDLSDDKPITINVSYRGGSYKLYNPGLFLAQRFSSKLSYSLYADYLNSDGCYPFKYKNGNKEISEKRRNSDIEVIKSELNLFYNISDKQKLDTKVNALISKRGLPGSVVYDNNYAAERLSDKTYFINIKYENYVSDKFKFKGVGRLNYSWNKYVDKQVYETLPSIFKQYEGYFSGVCEISPIKNLSFALAQDYTYNYLDSNLKDFVFPERNTLLSSISGRYSNKYISLTASCLYTYIEENTKKGEKPDNLKRLSPALSLSVKPFNNSNLRFRGSYKEIFRSPTFNDLYFRIVGNVNLKPEVAKQINGGITYSYNPDNIIDYISFSSDFYHNEINNKIVAIPTSFIWKMMNVSKVKSNGADFNFALESSLTNKIKFNLSASYSYMSSKDKTDKNSALWNAQLPYTPLHSGNGMFELKNPVCNVGYSLMAVSKRYSSGLNNPKNEIPGYYDHSVWIEKSITLKNGAISLRADAGNLSNKNYEVIRFFPMPGRNYRLSIAYKF